MLPNDPALTTHDREVPSASVISAKPEDPRSHNSVKHGPRWDVIALLLTCLLLAAIRWRLREMPLERDEGEYAYAGQLMLQEIPPYQIAYNMKLPGTYAAYAAIMAIFGQSDAGIRLGLLITNLVTIFLVYAIGKRLLGSDAGAFAAITYGLLSVGPWVHGFAGHATHFVVLTAMAGLLLLVQAIEEQRLWKILVAGLFLGAAFVMKQPGAAFGIFGALYLARVSTWRGAAFAPSVRRAILLGFGMALPFALTCLLLQRAGVFARFWFWTFSYAYQYGTNVGWREGWHLFVPSFSKAALSALPLWTLAAIGLTAFAWNPKTRARADFLLGLILFSGLAASAGLYFRPHYFILLLPAASLLVGLAVSSAADVLARSSSRFARILPAMLFSLACVVALADEANFFFQADPVSASRYVYPKDPFPECAAIGHYIEQNFPPSATMAMLGSEPQIMFYSRHNSVTGYLYTYSLTEEQKYAATMQRELISEIETARPDILVHIQDWMIRPRTEKTVFAWYGKYISENYVLLGVMRVNDSLKLRSEADARRSPGHLDAAIFLYQRRGL